METQSTGARARRVGATLRGGGSPRRGGWWWLLAILLLLAAIAAVVLILTLGGSSHHHQHPPRAAATPGSKPTTTASSAVPSATGTAPAGSTTAAGASSGQAGVAALIGGGGIVARRASGRLAPAGSFGDVLFTEDGTALDTAADQVIARAASDVNAHRGATVTVVGYTDRIGNPEANRTLSLERARTVEAALRRRAGDPTARYRAVARGETHPVASNRTPDGRQLDRRVTIFVRH